MILVTGPTGFIGQHLVKHLVEAQYPVCGLIRPSPHERRFTPGVKIHIVAGDLSDLPALRVALYHATHVVHLAGIWEETDRDSYEAANLQGTRNLIEAMHEVGVKRLITLTLIGAHTHSAYPYMRIKAQVDDILESSELDYTQIELSAVYGPGDNLTESIALVLRRFPFFFPIPGDGKVRLQPLYVNDLVKCILSCIANDKTANKTFALGGPQQMTYDELVNLVMQATGHVRRKRYVRPATAIRWSNGIRSLLGGRTLYNATQLELLSVDRTTEQDAVSFHFGFTPVRMASVLDYLR
jgi:NADH dehydrogenase